MVLWDRFRFVTVSDTKPQPNPPSFSRHSVSDVLLPSTNYGPLRSSSPTVHAKPTILINRRALSGIACISQRERMSALKTGERHLP